MFEHNHIPELVQEILRGKALALVVESAVVTDTAPAPQPKAGEQSLADKAGDFLQSAAGQAIKSAVRQAANQLGRQLVRGLMGSLLGGKKR